MFLSSNSSFSSSSNITIPFTDQQQQQHPMFDKPFFSNDVSPNNFKHYQHHQPSHPYLPPFPTHEPSFFHFSPTFIDHNHEEEVGFLQNHHHHHQEVLLTTSLVDTFATIIPTTNTCSQTLLEAPPYNIAVIAPMKGNGSKMIKNDKKCLSNDLITTNEKINSLKNKRCSSTTSKKDRHSKIITAQGPRDRRMRLSLKVARPFFTLQDMLGFDKASKTVEWLLMNSKTEINELKRNRLLLSEMTTNKRSCSGSYTSECEVVSEIEISNTTTDDHQQGNAKKEKRVRRSRKPPTFHPLAKESRAKARERARERTIGKIWSRSMPPTQCHPQGNNNLHNNLNQSRSTGPFEFDTGEESGTQSHEMKSTLEMVAEVEEPSSHSFEDSIVINSNSSASQMFNYQHEIKTSDGINWDIDDGCANSSFCATSADINHLSTGNVNDPISSPFHLTTSDARVPSQLIDFQFFDKPWQTYNSEGP